MRIRIVEMNYRAECMLVTEHVVLVSFLGA